MKTHTSVLGADTEKQVHISELEGFVEREHSGTAKGRRRVLPRRPEQGSQCESVSCICKSIFYKWGSHFLKRF